MGWQGRKRPTSLKTMGRQEKMKLMVLFLKAVGLKPAAFFVFDCHSVYTHLRYYQIIVKIKAFLKGVLE